MARNLSALVIDPNLDSRLQTVRTIEGIGLDSAGEAAYGTEATFMVAERKPNIILISVEEPPARAIGTMEALQQQSPDAPVLVYSSVHDGALMRQAMRAGARDFLEKPLNGKELRDAVHSVLAQEEQRQLARWVEQSATTARGTVITVAGAKGGIGKTTLATNLALALRNVTGQEVAIVDGDAQFGDVGVMLAMEIERSIADLARKETDITRASIQNYLVHHESGINALMAGSEPEDWRAVNADHISKIAQALAETHEYVIIDTPGAMNDVVAASLNAASIVMLVTSLDVSSVKDTKTALRILESWAVGPDRIQLTVNDITRAAAVTPEDVARATGIEVTRVIPHDAHVGLSVQTGIPIVLSDPRNRFAREVMGIAESIAGVSETRVTRLPFGRLLRRA
jgi:pilus assembly protein CpaE